MQQGKDSGADAGTLIGKDIGAITDAVTDSGADFDPSTTLPPRFSLARTPTAITTPAVVSAPLRR